MWNFTSVTKDTRIYTRGIRAISRILCLIAAASFGSPPSCFFYFASGRDAKYCDQRICMSVCLHISNTTRPNFTKFSVHVTCSAVARFFSNNSCNTLYTSDLWMASFFSHNRAHVVHGDVYGRGMSVSGRQRRQGAKVERFISVPL